MQKWYQAKEGASLQHKGQVILPGKKIWLYPEYADIHNSVGEQVVECPDPIDASEAALLSDWEEWQAFIASTQVVNNVTTPTGSSNAPLFSFEENA